ncbi:PH domain-containing protein [Lactobacillus sp. S2-2]|uniref:PH domain-containing protein n=1 Tax=Lactobacillus sp. S2-2 TaxID=2692917 RepID=UPI001F3BC878|nr:PH domain-containing protein [Lactobacillus sp. S2-2]MCF6515283.1 PH domain-containing protein [Lactobacillus sp. S2-2]
MSKPEHLHPFALIINLINTFLLIFSIVTFLLTFFSNKLPITKFWGLLLIPVIIYAVLEYAFTTYQITEKSISLKSGIFFKKEKIIPYSRIQAVHQRQPFLYQPFNLTHVGIDTANKGDQKAEIDLPVIKKSRVELIEKYRLQYNTNTETNDFDSSTKTNSDDYNNIFDLSIKKVMLFALTDISTIFSSIIILLAFTNIIPFNSIKNFNYSIISISIILITFALIVVFISIGKTFFKFFDYKLYRDKNNLIIETGLFQRKTQTIPVDKIQNIYLETNFARKLIHQTSLKLTIAGSQSDKDNVSNGKIILFPLIHSKDAINQLNRLIPELNISQPGIKLITKHDLHAIWLFGRWSFLSFGLISIGLLFYAPVFSIIPLIILIISFFNAIYNTNHQGIQIQSINNVVVQKGFCFGTNVIFFSRKRIKDLDNDTTLWLYKRNRGHITFNLLNGSSNSEVKLRFIKKNAMQKIDDFYQNKSTN